MIPATAPGLGRIVGTWTFDPGLVFALVASALLYQRGTRRARGRWPAVRTAAFLAGLAVVAVALLSGVDAYADELLSVHIVQHLLLAMVAPALLACGAPARLVLAASSRGVRRRFAAVLRSAPVRLALTPAVSAVIVCALMLATYLTALLALTLRDQAVHELEHAALLLAGLALFVPLAATDPLPHPPSALVRLGSLTAVMTAMVVVGATLSVQGSVRYSHYLATARALHISGVGDQHLAGVVMWFGGGLLGAILTVAFVGRALLAEERRQRRRDLYSASPAGPRPARQGNVR